MAGRLSGSARQSLAKPTYQHQSSKDSGGRSRRQEAEGTGQASITIRRQRIDTERGVRVRSLTLGGLKEQGRGQQKQIAAKSRLHLLSRASCACSCLLPPASCFPIGAQWRS